MHHGAGAKTETLVLASDGVAAPSQIQPRSATQRPFLECLSRHGAGGTAHRWHHHDHLAPAPSAGARLHCRGQRAAERDVRAAAVIVNFMSGSRDEYQRARKGKRICAGLQVWTTSWPWTRKI